MNTDQHTMNANRPQRRRLLAAATLAVTAFAASAQAQNAIRDRLRRKCSSAPWTSFSPKT